MAKPNMSRNETTGELDTYAWPGGYPIMYVCRDGGVLCPRCANDEETHDTCDENAARCAIEDAQWCLIGADANWEDPALMCDHCGERIESAYAEDEVEEEQNG